MSQKSLIYLKCRKPLQAKELYSPKSAEQCFGAFSMCRKEVIMAEKTIYCLRCGRKVATYDGKSTIDKIADCKKCHKRVIYRVATGETELKDIPVRATSSGKTFY